MSDAREPKEAPDGPADGEPEDAAGKPPQAAEPAGGDPAAARPEDAEAAPDAGEAPPDPPNEGPTTPEPVADDGTAGEPLAGEGADPTEEEDGPTGEDGPTEERPSRLRWVLQKLEEGAQQADEAAARLASAGVGPLIWPIPIAMGAGVGAWMFKHTEVLATLDTNKLGKPERAEMLRWVGGALGAFFAAWLVTVLVRRFVTRKEWSLLPSLRDVGGWLSFTMALPFAVFLRLDKIETQSPKLAVVAALLAALAVGRTFYFLPSLPSRLDEDPDERPTWRRALALAREHAPLLGAIGLAVAYGLFFSRLSITNHQALNTRTTDLGYYDNIFYQSSHGKFLGCSFLRGGTHRSAHFDPILVLLSPLYYLAPRAELLLALQSFWLGMGAIPVFLLARAKLGRPLPALALAACYTLFPALHGANLYEFHSLTLINPLVVWLLFFFETRRLVPYYLTLGLLLLCREDVPLLLCFVGAFALISGKSWGPRLGRRTIAISLVYFVLAKFYFMSGGLLGEGEAKESYSYTYYYEELIPDRSSAKELVISLLTNPTFVLKLMSEEAKINFLFLLFVPLLLLPALARRGRVMLVYGLAFCLLASRDPVYTVHFQYTSVLTPILFALAPMALADIAERGERSLFGLDGRRLVATFAAGSLVASLLVSWKFGAIAENLSFRGGFSRVVRGLTPDQQGRYAWVREQVARIPPYASVASTPRMGPHVSNRKEAYFYPDKPADFVFLDESELKPPQLEKHRKSVAAEYVELSRNGRLALFHRKKSRVTPLR